MCGIIGLILYKEKISISIFRRFEIGVGLMKGRGPDGFWIFGDNNVLLCQTSLLITDPSEGYRPYSNNDLSIIACANGEIYNSDDLRSKLEKTGAIFRSDSDCEVLAHGYEVWKEKLFEKLDGMFAVAIYDQKTKLLTVARDKVGIRPLYYTNNDKFFAFASEPRFLIESGLANSAISEEGLFHSLIVRNPIEPYTMYKDVSAVLPGQVLSFGVDVPEGKPTTFSNSSNTTIWTNKPYKETFFEEDIYNLISYSVERRIPKKIKYGAFLSGGLDSTIINFMMPRDPIYRIQSMVCGFDAPDIIDEKNAAKHAAKLLNIDLHSRTITPETFLSFWPFLVWLNSGPLMFNSSIPLYMLCKEANSLGAKVMLSGEGADELFAGYSHYPYYNTHEDDGSPDFLFDFDEEIINSNLILKHLVKDKNWAVKQWSGLKELITNIAPFEGKHNGLNRKLKLDRQLYLNSLLMRQDRVGLNASIEIRVPYLDHKIIKEINDYNPRLHLEENIGKILLRKSFEKRIAGDLAWISKSGFPVPFKSWILSPEFKNVYSFLIDNLKTLEYICPDACLRLKPFGNLGQTATIKELWTILNISIWWFFHSSSKSFSDCISKFIPEDKIETIIMANNNSKGEIKINFDENFQFPFLIFSRDWKSFKTFKWGSEITY